MPRTRAEERRAAEIDDESPATNESQESVEQKGYVKYIGLSHARLMTQEDLLQAGFSGKSLVDLVWNKANSFTVARADIPDDVYERAIVPDMELVLVDGEGQRM